MKRNPLLKYIYKIGNRYHIRKTIKGKDIYFKSFKSIDDAIKYRDLLAENDWKPLPETSEEKYEREYKEYYRNVLRDSYHTMYRVANYEKYYGVCKTIEEALYYRDLAIRQGIDKKPKELDLITNNPYIRDGLKFPLPDRLILPDRETKYGKGTIVRKGRWSFHVHYGGRTNGRKSFVCACRTWEMAVYVRNEMRKVNWDMSKLDGILKEYPRYYTWLLFFYQYITKVKNQKGEWTGQYKVVPPLEYTDGKLEGIIYGNLEDALFERDFLKEHDWDYTLLVETIDDTVNPYYSMELPPYPTRRVKRVKERDYHEEELTLAVELIREGLSQQEITERLDCGPVTFRNWLKNWNTNWAEFGKLALDGVNPLDVLEKKELIIQPDLSKPMPPNYNHYVSTLHTPYGIRYGIQRRSISYGVYPTEELAMRISKDMAKLDWDKSRLKEVQAKHGWQSMVGSRRWVYPNAGGYGWSVRHKNKDKRMINYGSYKDKRVANLVRDLLIEHDWNKEVYPMLREVAEWVIYIYDLLPLTMFGVRNIEDLVYVETSEETPYIYKNGNKFQVHKNNIYYGLYETKKQAEDVVGFLMDNNWDKELLKVMIEIGEI